MTTQDHSGTHATLADSGDNSTSQSLPRGSNLGRYVIIEPIGSTLVHESGSLAPRDTMWHTRSARGLGGHMSTTRKKIDWAKYEKGLRQRGRLLRHLCGSITFWFSEDVVEQWHPETGGKRGGQEHYSDIAIETTLTIRAVFGQALRQTEGLTTSIIALMGLDITAPDPHHVVQARTYHRRRTASHFGRTSDHCRGQHRPEDLRSGRMERNQARRRQAQKVDEAPSRGR